MVAVPLPFGVGLVVNVRGSSNVLTGDGTVDSTVDATICTDAWYAEPSQPAVNCRDLGRAHRVAKVGPVPLERSPPGALHRTAWRFKPTAWNRCTCPTWRVAVAGVIPVILHFRHLLGLRLGRMICRPGRMICCVKAVVFSVETSCGQDSSKRSEYANSSCTRLACR
jgi:hypothetical protein